ncbi:MAG: OmpH family outer membrane protein [Bacteroidales bacterium]|nr:OmpH family outer membrane protein [Bacteroidales bacterium]
MKKIFAASIMGLMLLAGATAFAQKATVAVGHINSTELLQQMPELENVKTELQKLQKELEESLETMQVEYNQKLDEYQTKKSTWSDLIISTKEQELVQFGERIQAFQESASQRMSAKQQELMQPIQEKAVKAIGDVAAEKGLLYVIDDAVAIFISPDAVDVMPDVKKKLGIN